MSGEALKNSKSSGGRTRPTIKQSPAMNRKNLRTWEIRLGLLHVVAFLGVVIGVMVCVFLLAFFHGHNAGFEAAARQSLDNIARLPIDTDAIAPGEEEQEAIEKQVYAALSADDQVEIEEGELVPDLGSIPEVDEAPIAEEDGLAQLDEALKKEEEAKLAEELAAPEAVKEKVEKVAEQVDSNVVQGEAGIKIIGETGSVIVIDEDKPQAAKKATLDELLSDQEPAITQPKEAAVVEDLLPEAVQPVIEKKVEKLEPVRVREELKVVEPKVEKPKIEAPKAVEPKVAPLAQSNFVRSVIPKGWYAQISAPRKLSDANPLANKLKNSGFSVMIEKAVVRGNEYFRILVGPEENKTLANRMLEQIKRESYVSGEPFIRNVR